LLVSVSKPGSPDYKTGLWRDQASAVPRLSLNTVFIITSAIITPPLFAIIFS
jgi:hypothetical protein